MNSRMTLYSVCVKEDPKRDSYIGAPKTMSRIIRPECITIVHVYRYTQHWTISPYIYTVHIAVALSLHTVYMSSSL